MEPKKEEKTSTVSTARVSDKKEDTKPTTTPRPTEKKYLTMTQ
jgi:hypothetical protein